MPCTRSMVTRSVSKPSTTKSRGRAVAADEDDMPPPPASPPPPKTRNTRTKKASKAPSQDSQEATTSKSSVSSSTRSTRNKGARSKAEHVEVDEIESNPPSPRPSRSTRQKPSTTTKQKPVEKLLPSTAITPKVVPKTVSTKSSTVKSKPEAKATASTSKGPTKRPRGRAKKVPVESVDQTTTDEENDEPKKKNLTLEQLHKHHVFPLKTALSVCEVFPKIMKKIADTDSTEKMEREFQELMNSEDMPPPPAPAPKPKGRGRKKRNRSPEAPSTKTDLPMSFNFAENKEDAPATKKMILDAPTPEDEALPVVPIKTVKTKKVKSGESSEQEAEVTGSVEAESSAQAVDKKTKKKKRVKKVKDEGSASEQEKAPSNIVTSDQSQETARKDAIVPVIEADSVTVNDEHHNSQSSDIGKKQESTAEDKEPKTGTSLHPQPKDLETTKNDQTAALDSAPNNHLNAKTNEMEKSISPISKLEVDENNIKQTNISPEVLSNNVVSNVKVQGNDIGTVDTPENNKKAVLEETFVFETPKEDDKNKTTNKLNTTFTPELCFSETPKSSRPPQNLNETVVISKVSSQACANKTEDDKDQVLAPESPEPANADSANGKVHSLVKYFDNQKPNCKTDATEKNCNVTPDGHNPNATFVLPPVKKDKNPPSLMNVTVCVKKGESSDPVREDSLTPTLLPPPPQKLHANPMQESAASRTFVKEPPSLTVVLEEEDEKIARLSKQNDMVHPVVKPIKEAKKGMSSSSSSSNSSMKSAVSQPCLLSKHKLPAGSNKNGPSHGSTGKLHDVHKSKPLEDAERRRQELLNQKVEQQKKKNEEWRKKAEKNNLEEAKKLKEKAEKNQLEEAKKLKEKAEKIQLEEAKKLKEKPKVILPSSSSNNLLKKPTQFAKPNADVGSLFVKPKNTVGMGMSNAKILGIGVVGGPKVLPSFPKGPFQKQPPPPPVNDYEMDESFKTASNSFLDATMEGHLSSYDITVYEDLDDDLKHRENKTIPKWASDKEALKEALFSMVLLQDYQFKIANCFPKPDKNFRLFPNKNY